MHRNVFPPAGRQRSKDIKDCKDDKDIKDTKEALKSLFWSFWSLQSFMSLRIFPQVLGRRLGLGRSAILPPCPPTTLTPPSSSTFTAPSPRPPGPPRRPRWRGT